MEQRFDLAALSSNQLWALVLVILQLGMHVRTNTEQDHQDHREVPEEHPRAYAWPTPVPPLPSPASVSTRTSAATSSGLQCN